MTTELEEQFFKTFGIEKREHAFLFSEPDGSKYYYPENTDSKLLEIVCILNKFTGYTSLLNDSIDDIREEILRDALFCHEQLKLHKADLTKQIKSLFKEEE